MTQHWMPLDDSSGWCKHKFHVSLHIFTTFFTPLSDVPISNARWDVERHSTEFQMMIVLDARSRLLCGISSLGCIIIQLDVERINFSSFASFFRSTQREHVVMVGLEMFYQLMKIKRQSDEQFDVVPLWIAFPALSAPDIHPTQSIGGGKHAISSLLWRALHWNGNFYTFPLFSSDWAPSPHNSFSVVCIMESKFTSN